MNNFNFNKFSHIIELTLFFIDIIVFLFSFQNPTIFDPHGKLRGSMFCPESFHFPHNRHSINDFSKNNVFTVRSEVSCTLEFDYRVTKFWPFGNEGNENFDFFVEKTVVSKSTNDQSIWVSYQKLA